MPRQRPSTVPAVIRDDERVQASLAQIVKTETSGQNLTWDEYDEMIDAIEDVLKANPDLVGQDPLHEDFWNLPNDLDLASWVVGGVLLDVHRGNIDAPSGEHGPWPGTRCVYCGSNDLDVDLYTVDSQVCPPVWACGADHPERDQVDRNDHDDLRRIAHCGLVPDHDGDHRYEWQEWARAYSAEAEVEEREQAAEWGATVNEDTVGVVFAHGPGLLKVMTWPRADSAA